MYIKTFMSGSPYGHRKISPKLPPFLIKPGRKSLTKPIKGAEAARQAKELLFAGLANARPLLRLFFYPETKEGL